MRPYLFASVGSQQLKVGNHCSRWLQLFSLLYVCSATQPVETTLMDPRCIARAFLNVSQELDQCDYQVAQTYEPLAYLINSSWVIITTWKILTTVFCHDGRSYPLRSSMWIRLPLCPSTRDATLRQTLWILASSQDTGEPLLVLELMNNKLAPDVLLDDFLHLLNAYGSVAADDTGFTDTVDAQATHHHQFHSGLCGARGCHVIADLVLPSSTGLLLHHHVSFVADLTLQWGPYLGCCNRYEASKGRWSRIFTWVSDTSDILAPFGDSGLITSINITCIMHVLSVHFIPVQHLLRIRQRNELLIIII